MQLVGLGVAFIRGIFEALDKQFLSLYLMWDTKICGTIGFYCN